MSARGETGSSGAGLFREEALRHHAGGRAQGELLRIPPSWSRLTFAFLVGAAVLSLGFAVIGRVGEYARGVARVVDPGTPEASVLIFFSERERARLAPGMAVVLRDSGDARRSFRARLLAVEPEPVALPGALRRLDLPSWPAPASPSRLVAVRAQVVPSDGVSAELTPGEILDATARVGERSLISLLMPAGRGGAP